MMAYQYQCVYAYDTHYNLKQFRNFYKSLHLYSNSILCF